MVSPECRSLTLADIEPAAQVIAQAFADDPLCAYMLPFERTRVRTLQKFFRAWGEVSIRNGRGYGVGDPLAGVAYWQAPDQGGASISFRSLKIFVPVLFTFYPFGYFRAKSILDQTEELHRKHADRPHFYLDNLGVLPSAQGQGLSSKLIRPFLAKADAQGVVAYTDTVTRSNVALYEHFGFQCVEERPVPRTGVTIWALKRPAQAAGRAPDK